MQGAPLYSVKWYRGNHEFYRYTPMESPDRIGFPTHGIHIDTGSSNGTHVVLRKLDLTLAGNFSCEVTADSPSFTTQIATKYIDIVALPVLDPVLKANKDRYQPGEVLRATCHSSPSKPAANLTIFINDESIRSTETSLHPTESGLYWASVNVEVTVSPDMFKHGRLRLSCVASIYKEYYRNATLDFLTPDADPRPERITLNNASKYIQSWILLFLLLFLPTVVMGEDYGFFSFNEDDSQDYITYEDIDRNSVMSLLGG